MKFFKKFTSADLLLISVLSALGLAVKPLITPLIHLVSAPLLIPGGSLAGGFYMMWISLAIAVVQKTGTGLLIGLVQGITVIVLGFWGNHGAVSVISYTIPGLAAELAVLFFKDKSTLPAQVTSCTIANIVGAAIVTMLVLRYTLLPLLISVATAALSGIIGGVLSRKIYLKLSRNGVLEPWREN